MSRWQTVGDGASVAAAVLRTSLRLGVDAVEGMAGRALPLDPEQICEPAFFRSLVGRHGLDPVAAELGESRARLLDLRSDSSNCNNSVIAFDHPASERELPRSAFLKLPSAEPVTRLFCSVIRIWELECRFYRTLAPRVPIRVPRPYAAAHRGTRFVLLLENLGDDPRVELFTNADMQAGPGLPLVERCLESLACLHASFTGLAPAERARLLAPELHPFRSPFMLHFARFSGALALGRCRVQAPDLLDDELAALFERALGRWDSLLAWWFREPLTLIHGDSHLGNFFSHGGEVGMLDWQAAQWGKGMRDVQYLLIDSLPAHVLEAHEDRLVRHYLSALKACGVELEFDDAWEQYRALSFQTWMTIVVSLGLGALTERDALMREILSRCVSAVRRLGFAEWLDALPDADAIRSRG